ncbi:hypothetical protein GCM10025794_35200 [Massilia kyonggiensis]
MFPLGVEATSPEGESVVSLTHFGDSGDAHDTREGFKKPKVTDRESERWEERR